MGLLELVKVSKSFPAALREEVVLDAASLTIEGGDFVGLWGGRRSGKSTLLRLMAGMERPDRGTVRFDGHDLASLSADARAKLLRVGGISLVWEWTPQRNRRAVDHVARALLCEGMSFREARLAAREALERVGVSRCAELGLRRLSPGEMFRVDLATALVRHPRLLLVDEPAILRSPSEREELFALLRGLGEDASLALLVASEDTDALHGATRMLAIGAGRLREISEPGVVLPFPRRQAAP